MNRPPPEPSPDPHRVGLKRMLWRSVRGKCPRCGGKGWFTGPFRRVPRCRACGFRYEREPGFSLGAMSINIGITFACIAVLMLVGFIASYPDVAVLPMLLVGGVIVIVVPTLGFRYSYTIWAAIDIAMHPLDAADVAEADIASSMSAIPRQGA